MLGACHAKQCRQHARTSGTCGWSCKAPRVILPAAEQRLHHMRYTATKAATASARTFLCCRAMAEHAASVQPSTPAQAELRTPNRQGLYDSNGKLLLKNLTFRELDAWCYSVGEDSRRAVQLWRWMYADPTVHQAGRAWAGSLEDTLGVQNGFSRAFVERFGPQISLDGGLELVEVVKSKDGTRKLIFQLKGDAAHLAGAGANASIETVLIPVVRQQGLRDRLTLCVSSQVGCAMNCQFCYTGRMGLLANLTTAQIVQQVVEARKFLAKEGDTTPLTNMVFMGMGEPCHNMEAVLAAGEIVSHRLGLHLSPNKITISTVGLVPEMRQIVARSAAQVALSLHATTDEVRDWIVPVNRRYDLATLTACLRELFPAVNSTPSSTASSNGSSHGDALSHSQAVTTEQLQGASSSMPMQSTSSSQTSGFPLQPQQLPQQEQQQGGPSVGSSAERGDSDVAAQRLRESRGASSSSGGSHVGVPVVVEKPRPPKAGVGRRLLHRSVLVEYVMLRGINDTLEDAHRLVDLLEGVNCKVNLIVFNPHQGTRFLPSLDHDVNAFRSTLIQRGLVCTVRDSRGDEEMAACGQLGNPEASLRAVPLLEAPPRFRDKLVMA